ncbi:MAG: hypothetical protein R3B06_15730 [Kofleriaceae bacterium]
MKPTVARAAALALALAATACSKKAAEPASQPAPVTPAPVAPVAPAPGTIATPPAPAPPVGPGAPIPPDGLRFTIASPTVGAVETKSIERDTRMTFTLAPGQTSEVHGVERREERQEILEVDGGVATKIRISYPTLTKEETGDGRPRRIPQPPQAGKTYLVWRAGGTLTASYEDGTTPPAPELAAVTRDNLDVGRPQRLEEIMAEHAWQLGQPVDLTDAELTRLNVNAAADDKPAVTALRFTLQAVDAATATFAMRMVLDQRSSKGQVHVELTGTAQVDRVTSQPVVIVGEGPMSGTIGAPVTGTMKMTSRYAR